MVVQMSYYVYAVHNYLLHDSIDILVAFHAKIYIYDRSSTIAKLDVIAISCNPLYLTSFYSHTLSLRIQLRCVIEFLQ